MRAQFSVCSVLKTRLC